MEQQLNNSLESISECSNTDEYILNQNHAQPLQNQFQGQMDNFQVNRSQQNTICNQNPQDNRNYELSLYQKIRTANFKSIEHIIEQNGNSSPFINNKGFLQPSLKCLKQSQNIKKNHMHDLIESLIQDIGNQIDLKRHEFSNSSSNKNFVPRERLVQQKNSSKNDSVQQSLNPPDQDDDKMSKNLFKNEARRATKRLSQSVEIPQNNEIDENLEEVKKMCQSQDRYEQQFQIIKSSSLQNSNHNLSQGVNILSFIESQDSNQEQIIDENSKQAKESESLSDKKQGSLQKNRLVEGDEILNKKMFDMDLDFFEEEKLQKDSQPSSSKSSKNTPYSMDSQQSFGEKNKLLNNFDQNCAQAQIQNQNQSIQSISKNYNFLTMDELIGLDKIEFANLQTQDWRKLNLRKSCEFRKLTKNEITLVIEPVGTIFTIVAKNKSEIQNQKNQNSFFNNQEIRTISIKTQSEQDQQQFIAIKINREPLFEVLNLLKTKYELIMFSFLPTQFLKAIVDQLPEFILFFKHFLGREYCAELVNEDQSRRIVRDISQLIYKDRQRQNIYVVGSKTEDFDKKTVQSIKIDLQNDKNDYSDLRKLTSLNIV